MKKPEFIMTFGISGSGKSTYLSKFYLDYYRVSTDDLRRELLGDISDQSNNLMVWSRAIGRIEGFLLSGKNVVLDATNTEFSKWVTIIQKLPPCKKIALYFNIDTETAYNRIWRDIDNGKDRSNVPEEVVYRQFGQLKYSLIKLPEYFDKVVEIKP
jgi:predicted kinase